MIRVRTTDLFEVSRAATALNDAYGPLSRMMRGSIHDAYAARDIVERVLPKHQAMLARAACASEHDTLRGAYADATAARGALTTVNRTRSRALIDYTPALDRLGRALTDVPDHLLDRRPGVVRGENGITGAFARRGVVEVVEEAERHRRELSFLGATGKTPWETLDAVRGRLGVSAVMFEERARATRVERDLRVRLAEVQRLIQNIRPSGYAFMMRSAAVLDGWQRTELRNVQRELLVARDAFAAAAVSGTTGTSLSRLVSKRLSEIRSVLRADADATRMLSRLGDVPRDGALSAAVRIGMADEATRGLLGSFAGIRTMDPYEMANTARLHDIRTRGWSAADVAPMHRDWERPMHTAGRLAAARGASGFLRDPAWPYTTAVDRDTDGARARWLSGEASGGSALFHALDFAIPEEEPEELHDKPLTSDEESRIAMVIAMVMWSQAARGEPRPEGQERASGKRISIAQPGTLLREIGGAVATRAEVIGRWAWTCPLWAVRAHLNLSERLTSDERLGLAQKRRMVPPVIAGATLACLSVPTEAAAMSCWMAELTIRAYYEDLARLCSSHGLDALVPDEWRHDG